MRFPRGQPAQHGADPSTRPAAAGRLPARAPGIPPSDRGTVAAGVLRPALPCTRRARPPWLATRRSSGEARTCACSGDLPLHSGPGLRAWPGHRERRCTAWRRGAGPHGRGHAVGGRCSRHRRPTLPARPPRPTRTAATPGTSVTFQVFCTSLTASSATFVGTTLGLPEQIPMDKESGGGVFSITVTLPGNIALPGSLPPGYRLLRRQARRPTTPTDQGHPVPVPGRRRHRRRDHRDRDQQRAGLAAWARAHCRRIGGRRRAASLCGAAVHPPVLAWPAARISRLGARPASPAGAGQS